MNAREHEAGRTAFLRTLSRLFFYWACLLFCVGSWVVAYRLIASLVGGG